MHKLKSLTVISLLLLSTIACNAFLPTSQATPTKYVIVETEFPPQEPNLPATEADVPRVSIEEALVAIAAGSAIIVDVRSQAAYEEGHVDGALSIPLRAFEMDIASIDIPKDAWIITYCT